MKEILTLILITVPFCLLAQDNNSEKIVKTGKVYTNHKLSYYYENDKRGNTIFTKNNGMNGPITMLFVSEYDSLNRETRTYFAHSNIGFSISENVYTSNKTLHYKYQTDSINENTYQRDSLNKINSQKEFIELKSIQQLIHGEKKLKEIEVLDSNKNVITEIYFSDQGDTSSINTRVFNSNNKEILFRYGIINKEPWIWDIYSTYDSNMNLIKSTRLSSKNGVKDTTEIYSYTYNSSNKLTSQMYHYQKDFRNKTEYVYDTNNKLIEERFYEGEEFELDVLTKYKYNKNGMLLKRTKQDFRGNGNVKRDVFTYKLIYW